VVVVGFKMDSQAPSAAARKRVWALILVRSRLADKVERKNFKMRLRRFKMQ
jgi:hypothetical protein